MTAQVGVPSQPRDGQFTDAQAEAGQPRDRQRQDVHIRRWQNRLLPFMLGAVIFMTLFFTVREPVGLLRLPEAGGGHRAEPDTGVRRI